MQPGVGEIMWYPYHHQDHHPWHGHWAGGGGWNDHYLARVAHCLVQCRRTRCLGGHLATTGSTSRQSYRQPWPNIVRTYSCSRTRLFTALLGRVLRFTKHGRGGTEKSWVVCAFYWPPSWLHDDGKKRKNDEIQKAGVLHSFHQEESFGLFGEEAIKLKQQQQQQRALGIDERRVSNIVWDHFDTQSGTATTLQKSLGALVKCGDD